jgi:dTDP-glucose 4,6-dehydratase
MQTKNILITGGAGFIGSHVVRLFVNNYLAYRIINLDKLTYAGNINNLSEMEGKLNYTLINGDICYEVFVKELFAAEKIDGVIHLATESHIDRSII